MWLQKVFDELFLLFRILHDFLDVCLIVNAELIQWFQKRADEFEDVSQSYDASELSLPCVVYERKRGILLTNLSFDHLGKCEFVVHHDDGTVVGQAVQNFTMFEKASDFDLHFLHSLQTMNIWSAAYG